MAKKQSVKQSKRSVVDFIQTISDSEEDIPDLDEETSDEEEEAKVEAKPTKKTKASKKKNGEKQNLKADDKEEGTTEDLNPDFLFSIEDDLNTSSAFQGWDFDVDASKASANGDAKKDVDLDSIIRRKGGLGASATAVNSSDEEEDEDDEEDEDEDDEDEDDEELAMDGFGMGAKAPVNEEEEEEEEEASGNEGEASNQQEEDAAEEELIQEQDNDDGEEDKEEDTAEMMAEFYEQETDEQEKLKTQVHQDFQSLSLSRPVLKGLANLGYTKPSPIQVASIPIALLGKDIVAGAVTGSGKTAAYMIPIIERLLYKPAKIASTRVIILAPTRELAIQVADVGKRIAQYVSGITFGLAVGGLNLKKQEQQLKERPDIVIATPGRLIDHIRNSPSFNVDNVEVLVFDEADRMLEEGFQKELTEILSLVPSKRQTMLFSATMNSNIKDLIQLSLRRPVRIMIDAPKQAATGLVQEFVRIRKREASKPALLFNILNKIDLKQQNRTIIFVSRKELAHRLRIILGLVGLKVSELHGSLTQEQRLQSVTDFKKLTVPILICTDLAARGLDIPKIEFVINYDMPKTHEIYLHRVGRTARAGREGKSISFVGESSQDRAIVKDAIKSVEESKSGKAVGRNVDWNEVEKLHKMMAEKEAIIDDVLLEEKQEKEMLRAEMELTKGENLLRYKDEINSRPKRTWFESEKEKKEGKVLQMLGKNKKVNSKKRKQEEAREESNRSYKKTKNDRVDDQERTYKKQTGKHAKMALKNAKKGGKKGGKR